MFDFMQRNLVCGILGAILMPMMLSSGCSRENSSVEAKSPPDESVAAQPSDATGSHETSLPDETDGHLTEGSADDFDAILKTYVDGNYFDYAALKANPQDLRRFESFLNWQADADISSWSREEQIAFYINAYNACSIKGILDHYPVKTPKDIPGFFDKITYVVAGETLTLSQIEYDRLIAKYRDMRAHFAVVCSDRSCLPLKPGAYTGQSLNLELEDAAQRFAKSEGHFRVDHKKKKVYISKIFDWYGQKFLKDKSRPVSGDSPELYLLPWLDEKTQTLLKSGEYSVEFIEWDWTLNERPAVKEND